MIEKNKSSQSLESLLQLQAIIKQRRAQAESEESYVAQLMQKGLPAISQKVGEEATEVIIAALQGNQKDFENEVADLLFHLMVLIEYKDSSLSQITEILANRMGVSGIEEKRSRK